MEVAVAAIIVIAALAAAAFPLFARRAPAVRYGSEGEISEQVERYRAALRANTLCEACLTANPEGSNYCMDCGRILP